MSEESEPVEAEKELVKFHTIEINQQFEYNGELYKRLHQKGCCGRNKTNALKISTNSNVFINKHAEVLPVK